jgi:amino acid adenylation domain-containing protein
MPIPVEVGNFLATQYPTGCWSDFLLAAFVIYLARSSGINCFDVGFRPLELRRDLIDLAGFFASYVPLHIDLNPHWSFEQVYEAIQAQVELVKQRSTYARDVGARYPEFEAAYELPGQHSWPVAVEQVEDLADYEAGFGCELMLVIPKDEANSACRWVYDPNLFDEHSIKRMCRQFTTLLQGIITANVEQPLMALTLLTEVEQHQVLVEWNDTGVDFPPDQGLHQLFEAQVERTPEAVAVVFEGEQLTYQALNRRANQLAHYLQRSGVGPETPVGICMERSLEMVIALFGVLKAGGAYVPLDPAYPQERLAFMVTDAQSPVLLAQRALANRLSGFEGQVICLDTEGDPIAGERDENPTCGATSDNAAYVIYTSGSTGKPKGVVISHRAICNHMHWLQMTFPLTETDTVLQKTPFSFDASVWEFYAPLLAGGRLVMARPGGHQDGSYLVKTIVEQQVTILQLVPSLLKLLLQEPAFETCDSLKRVFCGGEVLRVELVERFFDYLTTELINLYGPTEATIDATFWTCERQHSQQNVPIGRPIANMQAYILDSHLNPVPVGIPGELCLAGTGLARGYLNRPGLTAEKFVPNPFSRKPGERLYKTGDQARYLPDGSIEFLGRLDHQVKVRGYRIELGEIETTLRGHPVVRETVVLARQDVSGNRGEDKQLVAYLVPRRQPVPSVSELRHYLAEKLPDYMIPATFITLDALPLTPNGKVDRRALPVPGRTRPRLAGTLVAPRNPAEEALADIWADVLGLESVGIHDNFFELGGHSLLATRVASRIRDAFQVKILLAGLFEAPTIAALALLVEEMLIAEIEGLADDEVQHLL